MKDIEDLIWDRITESAKNKMDFDSLKEFFDDIDENIAENILHEIIIGFAANKTQQVLFFELKNKLLLNGIKWDDNEITTLLEGKEQLLGLEILACHMVSDMLKDGSDPLIVLDSINQLLE